MAQIPGREGKSQVTDRERERERDLKEVYHFEKQSIADGKNLNGQFVPRCNACKCDPPRLVV